MFLGTSNGLPNELLPARREECRVTFLQALASKLHQAESHNNLVLRLYLVKTARKCL
jgi:hypothetical protein